MTLATKALPGEITSFEDFVERALTFDFYTAMSDDHRVYLAGRRRREIMESYAENNELAGKLWKRVCKESLEGFMAGQLISRVERAVLDVDNEAAVNKLSDFVLSYLATSGRDTMIGKSVRDAIAKEIGAEPYWRDKEKRESQINDYISNRPKAAT